MIGKILVITNNKSFINDYFVFESAKNKIKDGKIYLDFFDNSYTEHSLILCIIQIKISVQLILQLTKYIKSFYSVPICVCECNIIQNYPGEIQELKGSIDIVLKGTLDENSFMKLIEILLQKNAKDNEKIERYISGEKITIYPRKRMLMINYKKVDLTKIEFNIFYYLYLNMGNVVTHRQIYENVWKKEYINDDTNIMAHIHRLRRKVEKDPKRPRYICNQYGVGYYFGGLSQRAFPTL